MIGDEQLSHRQILLMSGQWGVWAGLSVHVCATLHIQQPLYVLPSSPKIYLSILPPCAL